MSHLPNRQQYLANQPGTGTLLTMSHDTIEFTQEFWDDRYSSAARLWSGNVNSQLAAQVSGLSPGDALDAGCGEGADAIWLARHGWTVTAVDISAVALDRAAAGADAVGVANRITWRREDLLTWDPGTLGRFDLVTAQFMYLPDPQLDALHQRLAAAVRPGGTLLIVGHHADDLHANVGRTGHSHEFRSAHQVAAALAGDEWDIEVTEDFPRSVTDVDGHSATIRDTVLRASRRP
jgi:SAM-dependent methyltransferase